MPKEYQSGRRFRYFFIITAAIIAIASVWATNILVNKLKGEEHKKIELWAETIALLANQALLIEDTNNEDLVEDKNIEELLSNYDSHLLKILESNTTIPVIVVDDLNRLIEGYGYTNIEEDSVSIQKKINTFRKKRDPIQIKIPIQIDENTIQYNYRYVYYDDSTVLKQLKFFPFVQLTVVAIFIIISFLALNSTQRAEQNRVWVGLSKETAHQLGTPISSLMAWVEYFKTKEIDSKLLNEMDKDVQRLKVIAERFSKIGSQAEPESIDLATAIGNAIEYMGKRISSKVMILTVLPDEPVNVLMNESLFGWTLENLIKNGVDAMDGQGEIKINVFRKDKKVIMDISDTGKGIPKSKFDTIFRPGYTTKKRGWGLGLSLVKRIIESYQKGKIYVYKSELGKGTTFRIELRVEN